jgi:hypothetical protein
MDKKPRRPHLAFKPRMELHAHGTLLARLQTVHLLQMSERQIAELIREAETDPIFEKLLYPKEAQWKVIRFQPNPRTKLSPSFYELNDETLSEGARPEAAQVISEGREALRSFNAWARKNSRPTSFVRKKTSIGRKWPSLWD